MTSAVFEGVIKYAKLLKLLIINSLGTLPLIIKGIC